MSDTQSTPSTTTTHPELTPKILGELRGLLEDEKERLLDLYEGDIGTAREIEVEGTGDLADQAEAGYERESHFSAGDADRERLRLVEEALERIAEGSYGFCQHSDEPIALARLRAVPWARYTTAVQEKIEKGDLDFEA